MQRSQFRRSEQCLPNIQDCPGRQTRAGWQDNDMHMDTQVKQPSGRDFPRRLIGGFLVLLALLVAGLRPAPAAELRQVINLNREWQFQLGDPAGAEKPDFDTAGWQNIHLPHSFSEPYFLSAKFYEGYGWYRKTLTVPRAWRKHRINLEFDGAFQVAELFVNGKRIGEHRGGYTGFTFDLTEAVHTGDNVLAVRVNNLWNARLAPRGGEHTFSGGIYRDVRVVVTAPLHVAWYGTFVTTPQVSREAGTVRVQTEIANDTRSAKATTVQTEVLDAGGTLVTTMTSTQTVPPQGTLVFDQTSDPIGHPRLWSPAEPNLYSVRTTVLDGGKAVDDFTSPLGFRWLKWTADQGMFLNGEHYYFKGANVHQDHAGWGDAVADSGFYRDVKMVRDAGFDFIRGSHYPHAPAFVSACDELGVMFWSENNFWGSGSFHGEGDFKNSGAYPRHLEDEAEFRASVRNSLRDMIRIHRNHPSIIVWSMDNEVFFTDKTTLPKVQEFLKELVAYSHELDPTRPAAIGGCQRGDIDKLGDIAGYNGDGARLFLDPGIPSVISEYGSTEADRPGQYAPGWNELLTAKGLDQTQPYPWRFPWRSGEAIWCAFDHGSVAGKRFGGMGMIDYFRLPKRQYYWYRNEYRHIPPPEWPGAGTPAGLRLTADKTTLQRVDGTDDAQIIVAVVDAAGRILTNCPPVTLTIAAGPGEFPTGPSIRFAPDSDIVILDGQAAIEFRSYYAGETVIRASSPGLPEATLTLESLGGPPFVAGKTPAAPVRPYVRYTGPATASAVASYGLENPTRASSEAPGHSGRLANDANATTFWQAMEARGNAWWRVDLERVVTVAEAHLTFPAAGHWRYKIEISDDGDGHWMMVSDQTKSTLTDAVRHDRALTGARGRFVRVTFTGLPAGRAAALSEVEVLGSLAAQ